MSNVIAVQNRKVRDPAIPSNMEVEYFANATKLKNGDVAEFFLRVTGIATLFLPPLTVLGSFVSLTMIDVPTSVGLTVLIAGLVGIPVGALCGSALSYVADNVPERKIEKWLHKQGHRVTEDNIAKLMKQEEVILWDNPTGLKFSVKVEFLEPGFMGISYNVLKKPQKKSSPVSERKHTFMQYLTPSSQDLADSIQKQGTQLFALPLSIEDKHAVERVLSDLDELNKLGSMAQGAEPTKLQLRTLKTLNKEMKALAANVNSSMVKQLKIHASYVEERNRARNELSFDMKTRKVAS
jgi:hypothetical protein